VKIIQTYSHLNGLEFLLVHQPAMWREIQTVIASVDAAQCKTKVSKEKTMMGKLLYSPKAMNAAFRKYLRARKWEESRVSYWVTKNEKLIRKTLIMPACEQKKEILAAGETPIFSYNQTDFVKDRSRRENRTISQTLCGRESRQSQSAEETLKYSTSEPMGLE